MKKKKKKKKKKKYFSSYDIYGFHRFINAKLIMDH